MLIDRHSVAAGIVACGCFGLLHCNANVSGAVASSDEDAGTTGTSSGDSASPSMTGTATTQPPPKDGGGGGATTDTAVPGPACSAKAGCQESMTCCSGTCVDTSLDPNNCGKCGNACGLGQFCTGTACQSVGFSNLCDNLKATVVLDPYAPDNTAGSAIGTALTAQCSPPTAVSQASQSMPNVTDQSTGRPVTGVGNTFIAGGGSYGQTGVAYMQTAGLTTIAAQWDENNSWFLNQVTNQQIAFTAQSDLTANHDYFAVEIAVEPTSGTLFLAAEGMKSPGTQAAGFWTSTVLIPGRTVYSNSWYVYEWTDNDGDGMPSAGDTFTLLAQGK
jgi:hypothetical protein